MGVISSGASLLHIKIAVGPSAPPIIAIDAACFEVNPRRDAPRR